MSVVPTRPINRVQFYEDHIAPFNTNATAIGVTTTEVTELETKTDAARAAYDAQQVAQQAAKAATESFHNAVNAMSTAGAALIKKIRAKAEQTANPNVYALAQIPAPATPTPMGAPGQPMDFAVALGADGALTLRWKCPNPAGASGTLYQVYRKVEDAAAYTYLGGSGEKRFVDNTVPAGAAQIMYQIQAVRSTAVGPWATFVVTIGTVADGEIAASIATPKMAA